MNRSTQSDRSPRLVSSKGRAFRRVVRGWARDEKAGPIVEFALVVPVLLLLAFGVVDFARAFFQRNNLIAAVREGARFGAVSSSPCVAATQTAMKNRVVSYFTSVGGVPLSPDSVQVTTLPAGVCPGTPGNVTNIQVTVTSYPYTPITPLLRMLGSNAIRLQARAVYRWEQSPP